MKNHAVAADWHSVIVQQKADDTQGTVGLAVCVESSRPAGSRVTVGTGPSMAQAVMHLVNYGQWWGVGATGMGQWVPEDPKSSLARQPS